MSDSSHNELSDFSDVEDSKQSVETQAAEPPRIKLKLRLNPAVPPSDDKKKKHKDKKKKSHKKRKRLKEIDDDESAINDSARRDSELVDIGDDSVQHDVAIPVPTNSSTAHVPVGGKRPFAFIKDEENSQDEDQPSSFTDQQRIGGGPTNMDDDQDEDDEDTYSYTTERQYSISSQPVHPMEPMVTEESSKTQQKAKKRGRPSKSKAQPKAEPRASEQPKRDLKSVCAKLLDNLEKRDAYGFFLQPVDTTIVRDYLTVIKQPMDFSKMRKKLANNQYQTMDDFRNDFMLIVKNAKTYNAPDTIYYKSADRLEHTGLKAIEKAEKTVVYDSPGPNDDNESTYSRSNSWAMRRLSTYSGKNVKVEEEVDIMGLDNTVPLAPVFRHDSESALADSSRATTPTRQSAKKKKKKVTDAGVAYASDGSLSAIGSIDLYNLIPPDRPFASLPDITIANMNALPSAFYNNRSAYSTDDWSANKHFVRPAMYTDYAAMIATGEDPPGAFYTAQDACYIYPLYGDDRGEAYMRSLWEFLGDVNMEQVAESKANYLTKGAWDVLKQVLAKSDENLKPSFGNVNIAKVIQDMKSGAAQQ